MSNKVKCVPEINGVRLEVHGVRAPGAKRIPVWYWIDDRRALGFSGPQRFAIISARSVLDELPRALGDVQNQSEPQTDYFEKDRVRIPEGDARFPAALQACLNRQAYQDRRAERKLGQH